MKNRTKELCKKVSIMLLAFLLIVSAPHVLSIRTFGEALGAGKDVISEIDLKAMTISINNEVIYDSANAAAEKKISLKPNSTISFSLNWAVLNKGYEFQDGDYFSIPVINVENLRLTEPFVQTLELTSDSGEKVAVAEGKFTYTEKQLAFQVVFNSNAALYTIDGGPAGGYAALDIKSGQTNLPIVIGDENNLTIEFNEENKPGTDPTLPQYPEKLTALSKAVFSPVVNGNTVNLVERYATMQPGNEHKFGLDWRMTFFDLVDHFQDGGAASENVIIEDIVGRGQAFSNFAHFSGDRDKGFNDIRDEEYEAPFFIEIPIVAVGSNRIYNLHGDTTLNADSSNGYIGTLIRAGELKELSGSDVADKVRNQPLSWGIEKLDDGREKLIINLGKLGGSVASGEGLTADLVREKDYPYNVLDNVIVKELLDAQYMVESGQSDVEQWKRVRKESFDTILYYWPAYKDKLCDIAGIPTSSTVEELETALFAIPYSQLEQSKIKTLGYDERRAGGIASTMRIDSFVLRYRTVLSSVTETDISNSVNVTTGIITKDDSATYSHQFYADIIGQVSVGEIAFIKADAADGHSPGETTQTVVEGIKGLVGAEFEVYETGGTEPLKFAKADSAYTLQRSGDTTVLVSDSNGAFKISGLSPRKEYSLREVKAPEGYKLPDNANTTFQVSSINSKYYVITNAKAPADPDTSKPETSQPETSKPEISQPETSKPETSKPETSKPETSKPETSKPETSKPETSKPETSKPETSKPETSKPESSKPATSKTDRDRDRDDNGTDKRDTDRPRTVIKEVDVPKTSKAPETPKTSKTPQAPVVEETVVDIPEQETPLAHIPDPDVPKTYSPNTGDSSNVLLAALLMVMSSTALVIYTRKKQK